MKKIILLASICMLATPFQASASDKLLLSEAFAKQRAERKAKEAAQRKATSEAFAKQRADREAKLEADRLAFRATMAKQRNAAQSEKVVTAPVQQAALATEPRPKISHEEKKALKKANAKANREAHFKRVKEESRKSQVRQEKFNQLQDYAMASSNPRLISWVLAEQSALNAGKEEVAELNELKEFEAELSLNLPVVALPAPVVVVQDEQNFQHMNVDGNGHSLIIGCRPWDKNLEGVKNLATAHFMDRMLDDNDSPLPAVIPATFHHLNLNDGGMYTHYDEYYRAGPLAGTMSEFAGVNAGQFNMVLFDLYTAYHALHVALEAYNVQPDDAERNIRNCATFHQMLQNEGLLVVPVCDNFGKSFEVAQKLSEDVLQGTFSSVSLYSPAEVPAELRDDLDLVLNPHRGANFGDVDFTVLIAKK